MIEFSSIKNHLPQIDFYRNVGYLTYAIAASDNIIPRDKIRFMKNELLKTWYLLDMPDKQDDSDSLAQIELIFNWLLSHNLSSGFAMNCFEDYINKNRHEITDANIETLISYSEIIANKLFPKNETSEVIHTVSRILYPA